MVVIVVVVVMEGLGPSLRCWAPMAQISRLQLCRWGTLSVGELIKKGYVSHNGEL